MVEHWAGPGFVLFCFVVCFYWFDVPPPPLLVRMTFVPRLLVLYVAVCIYQMSPVC